MKQNLARREFLGAGASAIAYLHMPRSLFAFEAGDKPIPFLDAQAPAADKPMLLWDELTTWITPQNQFFPSATMARRKWRWIPGACRLQG